MFADDALKDAIKRIKESPKPVRFRLFADDITTEKLAEQVEAQGSVVILTDEGGLLTTIAGRYSDNPNADLYLKAYNCQSVLVSRKNGGDFDISRPFITLAMIVQPDVLVKACGVSEFVERGFLGRFLYSIPAPRVGTRKIKPEPLSGELCSAWNLAVKNLFDFCERQSNADTIPSIDLDQGATEALDAFRAELEPRLHPQNGDLARLGGWGSKLPGHLVRIAALYALLRASAPAGDTLYGDDETGATRPASGSVVPQISEADMGAAVALAPYLIEHARAALDMDTHFQDARQVATLAWIRRKAVPKLPEPGAEATDGSSGNNGNAFTARDAWRGLQGQAWAKTAADVHAVLGQLDAKGWIRRKPDPAPKRAGRPAAPTYEIHPKLISGEL
ncbi:DUF3987 domain-containing protein [Parafrankia sp. FMc6]|uniref:DUF3987 domain-containing protein n=1 Tax=Parafrankia soli TaxID=2599596 RepID=UPI0034D4E229